MKKNFFTAGFIVLLVVGYGIIHNKINKDYYDHRTIKLKDNTESIVVKRNSKLGVLTLSNQSVDQQTANYEWYIGDGSTFDLTDSTTFVKGAGTTGDGITEGKITPIEFDGYRFYWSPHSNGEGFVYLNYYPELNEEKGPFQWTVISGDSLTNFLIKGSVSSMRIVDVKKRSLFGLISE